MKPVITPAESQRLDELAADGIDLLMERAGHGVARAAIDMGIGYGDRVTILAGKGNNGGDGYVAARALLRRGVQVTVVAFGSPRAGTAAERARYAARRAGVRIVAGDADGDGAGVAPGGRWSSERHRPRLVIDAVFGAGFRGSLPDDVAAWTTHPSPVLAVDLPSGLDAASGTTAGPVFHATRSVTFHALKTGHLLNDGPDVCGVVQVVDIGLTGERPAVLVCEESDAPRPDRPRTAHKWSAGSVAVVGGSPGLTGAPLLTARSALHSGAGAVTIMCPAALQHVYAVQAPGLMTRGVGSGERFTVDDVDDVVRASARFDVLVVGPGLGLETGGFVARLLAERSGRIVIDADGLNAIAEGSIGGDDALTRRTEPTLITPHGGEFTRLTGTEPGLDAARRLAVGSGVTVLLKGAPTYVAAADGSEPWAVTSGGPELATIGTGDVLGGMIGALWSRGLDAPVAARSAAYWHGRAAAALSADGAVTAEALAGFVGRFAFGGEPR